MPGTKVPAQCVGTALPQRSAGMEDGAVNAMTAQPRRGAAATKLMAAESVALLRSETVGRVCIDVDGYPVALPINYVVDDTIDGCRIVVRSDPATVIGSYQGRASLEVDHFDLVAGRAWSVIVRGELANLTGRKPNTAPRPFVSDGRTRWMELRIVSISGRRFVADRSGFSVEWQLEPEMLTSVGAKE
jgi:nitroimidazol reductase NimA-like FMN-containing flavoprotein (pyridoxamine 5'-phosphate oxidase superfamily)